MATPQPVIISGGGLVGLCLGQALKHCGISSKIYERDHGLESRYGGWAISLQWAWPALAKVLPPELAKRIEDLTVDPRVMERELISYRHIDLETGLPQHEVMAPPHLRVSRLWLRKLLSQGLDITWGVTVVDWAPDVDGVSVTLSNGTVVTGWMFACAEGKNSKTKRKLMGEEKTRMNELPVTLKGLRVELAEAQIAPLRHVNPLIWEGVHPKTSDYIFFSTISTPEVNGSLGTEREHYEAQINLRIFNDTGSEDESSSHAEKLCAIKAMATAKTGLFKPLKDVLLSLPGDTEVLELKLDDWLSEPWPTHGGRIALLGDAAHAMTMFRGEAVNHGILDALRLQIQLRRVKNGQKSLDEAIIDYQNEVVDRGRKAVTLSRQACLDACFPEQLTSDSPLFVRSKWLEDRFTDALNN